MNITACVHLQLKYTHTHTHTHTQGLGIFAAVAAATTLPGLQEQMLWQKDECYVVSQERGCADDVSSISSISSISSGQKCAKRVAVKVVSLCWCVYFHFFVYSCMHCMFAEVSSH